MQARCWLGLVHLWAEADMLLATAGQSCIVPLWREDRVAAQRARAQQQETSSP